MRGQEGPILVDIPLFLRMTRYIDIKYSPYMQSV